MLHTQDTSRAQDTTVRHGLQGFFPPEPLVRRIQEDDLERLRAPGQPPQAMQRIPRHELPASTNHRRIEPDEVGPDRSQTDRMSLQENHQPGAAGERFKAEHAASRESINHPRPRDLLPQDVKQRLPDFALGGPDVPRDRDGASFE